MQVTRRRRRLARVQIGFATGGVLCAAAGQAIWPHAYSILVYTVSGAFLGFVLYAGRELNRGTRRGLFLSLVAQLAQVVHLNLPKLTVLFLAGPFCEFGSSSSINVLTLGVGTVGYAGQQMVGPGLPGTRLALSLEWVKDQFVPHPSIVVGINLVAATLAVSLWAARRDVAARNSTAGVGSAA